MLNKYLTTVFFATCLLMMTAYATRPVPAKLPILNTCGVPTSEIMKCLPQWSCQHAIRLDLRCLLNLNGTPLLGGLLGGSGGGGLLSSLTGGVTGGGTGGGTGILGGLLGR